MEFFNHTHCKYTSVKGFMRLYNYTIKHQYMIQEKAKKKAEIVFFFKKYGLEPTIAAFKVSKSSIYSWHKTLEENQGRIESLNEKSKAPKKKRAKKWSPEVVDFIIEQRIKHPRIGKSLLKPLVDEFCVKNNVPIISESTIGRIIAYLKKTNKIPQNSIKVSFYAKTGKIIEKQRKKPKKKLRRKRYQPEKPGDLLQIDTIVKFINGIKRYIITAIDIKSKFVFAYAYSSLSSNTSKDFFEKLQKAAPFDISHIQNDNGQEFLKNFQDYLLKQNVVQFFNYPKKPQMNCYIENFNRYIQEEFIDYNLHLLAYNLNQFNHKLIDWLLWYNTIKPHTSLNKKPPLKYLIENLGFSKMLWTCATH